MGVINVTPDSFSDGGLYLEVEDACNRASELISQGADILDIGAQSTRPQAIQIGTKEELRRLIPSLSAIRRMYPSALISIDTFDSKVAEEALLQGANWINDVSAGRHDSRILHVVAQAECPFVITHSRGDSETMDSLAKYKDVTKEVLYEMLISTEDALRSGIKRENIVWDPGLGFAKNTHHCITLLKEISIFIDEGFPILLGPSRKRFIGEILEETNLELRIWGTAVVATLCAKEKVSMIRVHDAYSIKQTLKMAEAIF